MGELITKRAENIDDENLTLIRDQYNVNKILDYIGEDRLHELGLIHDLDSIIKEDSFSAVLVGTEGAEYSEVWGFHNNTVYKHSIGYKLR